MGRLLARNFSGPSIKFDGSATQISNNTSAANALIGAAGVTACAWVNLQTTSVCRALSISGGGSAFSVIGVEINNSGSNSGYVYARSQIGDTTQSLLLTNLRDKLLNKTVYIAAQADYTNKLLRFYINGVLAYQVTGLVFGSNILVDTAGGDNVNIGSAGGSSYFNGYIAEPAIFNRVLTAEEIRAIYEQGPDAYPKDGSCVLDYRFKEGAIDGAQIVDSSGKGNHGTLTLGAGRIDPYNIPVPNRVIIAPNMPLVGLRSDGSTGINISDANIAAAFGVDAGQVGVNGISAGAWVKEQRHVVNGQNVAYKYLSGASGYGAGVILGTTLQALFPTTAGAGSTYVEHSLLLGTASAHRFAAAVNGITYGKCFHNGIKTKQQTAALTGNGSGAFNLISSSSGNITLASMFFLANRVLTDSEVYNIYADSVFPADVLFWHGPDETGTKIACYRGSYSPANRVSSCDGTLSTGITFTDDVPWR